MDKTERDLLKEFLIKMENPNLEKSFISEEEFHEQMQKLTDEFFEGKVSIQFDPRSNLLSFTKY